MIFDQNGQIATNRTRGYVAKQFDLFWTKRAIFSPIFYIKEGLREAREKEKI